MVLAFLVLDRGELRCDPDLVMSWLNNQVMILAELRSKPGDPGESAVDQVQ